MPSGAPMCSATCPVPRCHSRLVFLCTRASCDASWSLGGEVHGNQEQDYFFSSPVSSQSTDLPNSRPMARLPFRILAHASHCRMQRTCWLRFAIVMFPRRVLASLRPVHRYLCGGGTYQSAALARPQPVAEGLDDVIGSHADVEQRRDVYDD